MSGTGRTGTGEGAGIQGFAGIDTGRVTDAVSAVWNSRDEAADAVRFVRDHGDDIVDLIKRLPALLGTTAAALDDAATDVAGAAAFLTGGAKGTTSGDGGVKALAELAADALQACQGELADAKALLERVGAEFAKLPIPSVEPRYSEVMGVKIISGLEIGDQRLLAVASERVADVAQRFDGVGDRLADVAVQLRKLGSAVDRAGHGLADTAVKLEAGGAALAKFGGSPR